jgi:hypothetical protein
MPNVIQPQIVHNHRVPVTVQQLVRNMPRHIVIHFREILHLKSTFYCSYIQWNAYD